MRQQSKVQASLLIFIWQIQSWSHHFLKISWWLHYNLPFIFLFYIISLNINNMLFIVKTMSRPQKIGFLLDRKLERSVFLAVWWMAILFPSALKMNNVQTFVNIQVRPILVVTGIFIFRNDQTIYPATFKLSGFCLQ